MIEMSHYGGFAYLYDQFMTDIPYARWAAYIDKVLQNHGINYKSIVLDMACGTGNITLPLAQMGYDMIGVDISADMLSQAQGKINNERILFLQQDMRQLDLYGTVDAVVCACDGLNYLLNETELENVFSRVKMFLNSGGVFIFDMNTEYKFQTFLGNKVFAAKANGAEYEWSNNFNADTGINEYQVVFVPENGSPFTELHRQRAYPSQTICNLLSIAGFRTIEIHDDYSDAQPKAESIRVTYIAK